MHLVDHTISQNLFKFETANSVFFLQVKITSLLRHGLLLMFCHVWFKITLIRSESHIHSYSGAPRFFKVSGNLNYVATVHKYTYTHPHSQTYKYFYAYVHACVYIYIHTFTRVSMYFSKLLINIFTHI